MIKTFHETFALLLVCVHVIICYEDVYISMTTGQDNEHCGGEQNPCKTLEYTWKEKLHSKNATGYIFILSDGYYTSLQKNVLMFGCKNTNISSISVSGSRNSTKVELNYSLLISNCQIQFNKLSFSRCPNHMFLSSNVTFNHVTMSDIQGSVSFLKSSVSLQDFVLKNSTGINVEKGLYFSDCSRIYLLGVSIVNNSLSHVFSIAGVRRLDVKVLTIERNVNSSVLLEDGVSSSIFLLQALNNENFRLTLSNFKVSPINSLNFIENNKFKFLVVENSSLSVITLFMQKNIGNLENDKYISVGLSSVLAMSYGNIDCNKFVNSTDTTLFSVDKTSFFGCEVCTMYNCPMQCPAGQGVYKNVFCKTCPPGSSAHDWERTCSPCFEGSYASENSSTDCTLCPAGKYCDKRGCTSCQSCSNDFLTSYKGAAGCSKMKPLLIGIIAAVVVLTFGPIACLVIKKYKGHHGQNSRSRKDDKENIINDDGI